MSAAIAFDPTEARRQRGLAIAALCRIVYDSGMWVVPAQSGRGRYFVDPNQEKPRCSCPDFEERGQPCKHVFAVRFVIEREKGAGETVTETVMATVTMAQTVPQKRTYRQAWPAYNAAQVNEKAKFQTLLADLCRGIRDAPRKPGPGRKPIRLADMVFSMVFKTYSTFSGRRFQTDLREASAKGHIAKAPHYNTVFDYFEDAGLTPILRRLIEESSLPLKAVEVDFAADSTGLSTSRYARWFDHKYGRPMQECEWVKLHAMTGVKTNVIAAVELGIGADNDSPQFIPLLKATAKNFRISEVSADAAYASYANMEAAGSIGAVPYMAFPSNTTAAGGGLFAKMFHLYNLNRDEYLAKYHKRSNVESTFSMLKAKHGAHLRSKTDEALINESLCKVLAHNLCVLIQSHYELGIAPMFWGADAGPMPEEHGLMSSDDFADAMVWI